MNGVKVSINPDDHGFFCSDGVTMDYVMAYLCWGLSLLDLKQLCLNSIEYASVSDSDKVALRDFFDYKWGLFLKYVRSKYWLNPLCPMDEREAHENGTLYVKQDIWNTNSLR